MYRDLIGDPERIEYNGQEWWVQVFCYWDGNVKAVHLYDAGGNIIGEFPSREDAIAYMDSIK